MSPRPLLFALAPLALVAADGVSFNRDVQPILSEYCYHCHGPDSSTRKSGLRLDRPEFAFTPAKSGDVVIIKGDPDKSPLIARILNKDPDEVMTGPSSPRSAPSRPPMPPAGRSRPSTHSSSPSSPRKASSRTPWRTRPACSAASTST